MSFFTNIFKPSKAKQLKRIALKQIDKADAAKQVKDVVRWQERKGYYEAKVEENAARGHLTLTVLDGDYDLFRTHEAPGRKWAEENGFEVVAYSSIIYLSWS